MKKLLFLTLLISFSAHASGKFSLEKRGEQICRTETDKAELCLPTLKALGYESHERIELVDRLKSYNNFLESKKTKPEAELSLEQLDAVGGSILLTEDEVRNVLNNYRRLSVRNIAFNSDAAEEQDGSVSIPFFASVYWQGAAYMEGTIHVEGQIKIDGGNIIDIVGDGKDTNLLRQHIAKILQIQDFSDSTTEQKIEALRILERIAREIHFRVIGTEGQTVDEATLSLLKNTVAPMVFGEIIYVPTIKTFMGSFAEILNGFKKVFDGIFQTWK